MKTENDFFEKISALNGISPLWEKVLDMLKNLDPSLSQSALDVFCIYFSLLDDGNACIPLDKDELLEDWLKKWNGLLLVSGGLEKQQEDKIFFADVISAGLKDINKIKADSSGALAGLPFVVFLDNEHGKKYLFAKKYYQAKLAIEERMSKIFTQKKGAVWQDKTEECEKIKKYFSGATLTKRGPIELKSAQAQAIVRGQNENLIITGGPGTGKTTVVCYLLWELLAQEQYSDYSVYLAAPSGKAADRLKESVSGALESIKDDERKKRASVFEKLNSAQGSTIHRLLSYNPQKNSFSFGKNNQFLEKSIFVIDEASMIDITLFASLLQAIPDKARVFILGDKDQLPSVQAGAVLGEMLSKRKQSVVALVESNRFNDDSMIGALKNAMQKDAPLRESLNNSKFGFDEYFCKWEEWKNKSAFCVPAKESKENPVVIFNDRNAPIKEIASSWSGAFYDKLASQESSARDIDLNQDGDALQKSLESLWSDATRARILCAEREGEKGVANINKIVCAHIAQKRQIQGALDDYFAGELLMIAKNQAMFNLYNGDSGIVVTFKTESASPLQYLMVKKELRQQDGQSERGGAGIFSLGPFVFYPLYLLPSDSIEVSYAITIHKSQGSGYSAILVFIPQREGHPLLNRQIVYTAITRTQGSTYIVASEESLECARKNCIERRAMIDL